MVDPLGRERGAQRLCHVLLPDHLGKRRWTILAIKGERHAATLPVAEEPNRTHARRWASGSAQKGTPCTRQSSLILAAFRPWGGSRDGRRTRSAFSVAIPGEAVGV